MDQTLFLEQQLMPTHSLYVVGTPIGNLGDISYRAVYVLQHMDGIACEDTRHTANLLKALGLHKPLISLHEHNESEASGHLISKLQQGERWAYVCDAGTPGISDPGARLTDHVRNANLQVIPIPGPSAVSTLMSVAGQRTHASYSGFQFVGFLPLKGKERNEIFSWIEKSSLPTVFFEAPQRVKKTLLEFYEKISDKDRTLVLGRELTKKFEQISFFKIEDIPEFVKTNFEERGEFCILLSGANPLLKNQLLSQDEIAVDPQELIKAMSSQLGSKQIAEILCAAGLMSKKAAYDLSLQIKNPQ
jgi:16S rRNA (cytidine1402-2'-O)-methyltransferase